VYVWCPRQRHGAARASAQSSSSVRSPSVSSRRRRPHARARSACLRHLLRTCSSGGSAGVRRLKTRSSSLARALCGATTRGATGAGASSRRPPRQPALALPYDRTTCATRSCRFSSPKGANVVEIARQAGHSPTMTLSTYAHLSTRQPGASACPPRTRSDGRDGSFAGRDVPDPYPKRRTRYVSGQTKSLQILWSRRPDSNRGPLHYENRGEQGRAWSSVIPCA
jgi:hypothetical protein